MKKAAKVNKEDDTTMYKRLAEKRESKTSVDSFLPSERDYMRETHRFSEFMEEEKGKMAKDWSDKVTFRMSHEKKEALRLWLQVEKDQPLSSGLRDIVINFMKENRII